MLSLRTPFPVDDIDSWIFDLDNTIYPATSGLFDQVAQRMTAYIQKNFKLNAKDAGLLRQDLFHRYGTTAKGLMVDHDIDPNDFLSYVHDIDLSDVSYDPDLDQTLSRLSGKKVIFTNGTTHHANRILEAYRINHHFDYCYDIIESDHRPKPDPQTYTEMLSKTGINPERAVMIEDMAVNLKPAADLGITTVWLDLNLNGGKPEMVDSYIDYIACDLKQFFSKLGE
jgi:putative hydrolase of the HAD superfamily